MHMNIKYLKHDTTNMLSSVWVTSTFVTVVEVTMLPLNIFSGSSTHRTKILQILGIQVQHVSFDIQEHA